MKLALNQLGISLTAALSSSLGYLKATGVHVDIFMNVLRKSPLYSKGLEEKTEKIMQRDFSHVLFPLKLLLKDINLMVDQFMKANIDVSLLQGVQKVIEKGIAKGYSDRNGLSVYDIIHPI